MNLPEKHDRILDELRSMLEDWEPSADGESWQETLEDAMNVTWDALLKAGAPA